MKNLINATLATAVGIGAIVVAIGAPAYAGQNSERGMANTRSLTVNYSDLNLSRQEGIDKLYGRLKVAANKVCGPKAMTRNLAMRHDWKQCFNDALDGAVASVDHVGLSQVHMVQTGRRVSAERQTAGLQ